MADTRYDGPSVEVASYGSVPKIRWAAVGCSTVMIKMAGALGCHRSWFFYSKFLKVQYNSCFVFPQHHKLSPATLLYLTLGQKSIFCPKNSIWVNTNLNFRAKKTLIKELSNFSNLCSNWNILWTKNWFLPECGHVLFFFLSWNRTHWHSRDLHSRRTFAAFSTASFYTTTYWNSEQWSKDNVTKADCVSPKGNLQKNILHKVTNHSPN